ncbi:MAG: hypothetical protein RL589_830 [Actinomycetota bacterium]|jgi:hypothetical protein
MKSVILDLAPPLILRKYSNYKRNPARFKKQNKKAIEGFAFSFEVIEFSYIDVGSPFDFKWGWWSRIYEYPLALSFLEKFGVNKESKIHNTCWGSQGPHIVFKNELETISNFVINSDINQSKVAHTTVFDLRKEVPESWLGVFDFVINISTLEEIDFPHVRIFENLLSMVKSGGYLIITFDLPGLHLEMFEDLFGTKISNPPTPVSGDNSPYQMSQFSHLRVGYMVVRRS